MVHPNVRKDCLIDEIERYLGITIPQSERDGLYNTAFTTENTSKITKVLYQSKIYVFNQVPLKVGDTNGPLNGIGRYYTNTITSDTTRDLTQYCYHNGAYIFDDTFLILESDIADYIAKCKLTNAATTVFGTKTTMDDFTSPSKLHIHLGQAGIDPYQVSVKLLMKNENGDILDPVEYLASTYGVRSDKVIFDIDLEVLNLPDCCFYYNSEEKIKTKSMTMLEEVLNPVVAGYRNPIVLLDTISYYRQEFITNRGNTLNQLRAKTVGQNGNSTCLVYPIKDDYTFTDYFDHPTDSSYIPTNIHKDFIGSIILENRANYTETTYSTFHESKYMNVISADQSIRNAYVDNFSNFIQNNAFTIKIQKENITIDKDKYYKNPFPIIYRPLMIEIDRFENIYPNEGKFSAKLGDSNYIQSGRGYMNRLFYKIDFKHTPANEAQATQFHTHTRDRSGKATVYMLVPTFYEKLSYRLSSVANSGETSPLVTKYTTLGATATGVYNLIETDYYKEIGNKLLKPKDLLIGRRTVLPTEDDVKGILTAMRTDTPEVDVYLYKSGIDARRFLRTSFERTEILSTLNRYITVDKVWKIQLKDSHLTEESKPTASMGQNMVSPYQCPVYIIA